MRKILLGLLFGLIAAFAMSASAFQFPFLAPAPAAQSAPKEAKLKDGFITLYAEVNAESAKHIVDEIQRLNKSFSSAPIYLFINSPGGYIDAGGLIVTSIKTSKRPVYTVCVEECASMAAIIHQYGVKRFMLPYAVTMFHEAAYGVQGQLTHNRSREQYNEAAFAQFEIEVAKRSGCDIARFRAQENKEWWMLIDEATKEHFNDSPYTEGDFPAPKE